MALVVKDRVKETTTTTGTGTITLAGAASGFQSFSVIGNGNTTYYAIVGTTEWEVGLGTYSTTGPTLARTTVLESSNGGSLVNFSAGTKDVFVTYPAEKAVYLDASGDLGIGAEPQAGTILQATGATGAATDVRITNSGTAATDSVRLYLTTSTTGTTATNSQIIFGDGDNVNAGSILYQHGDDSLAFRTNGTTERMRIHSSGCVSVGNTTDLGAAYVNLTYGLVVDNIGNGARMWVASYGTLAQDTSATLTYGQLIYGLLTCTATAARTYTLPTGTTIDGAAPQSSLGVNAAFEWTILNRGSSSGAVTVAANTGHTVLGNMVVAINSQGTFRTRKTAANTYVTYRVF